MIQRNPQIGEIGRLVDNLNSLWMNKKLNKMERLFYNPVVMALSGTGGKITGRESIIENNRDFNNAAEIPGFETMT